MSNTTAWHNISTILHIPTCSSYLLVQSTMHEDMARADAVNIKVMSNKRKQNN